MARKKKKEKKEKKWRNIGGENPSLGIKILSYLVVMASFWSLDWWLRARTLSIGRYDFWSWPPHLFTIFYGVLISLVIFAIPNKRVKDLTYSIVFYALVALAVFQYGSNLIVGKFMTLGEFGVVGEGTHYFGFAMQSLGIMTFVWAGIFYTIGHLIKRYFLPNTVAKPEMKKKAIILRCIIAACCIIFIIFIPRLYDDSNKGTWLAFDSPAYEYETFSNPGFDMQLCGFYGYISRDIQTTVRSKFKTISEEELKKVDDFFAKKSEHKDNSMTGIYKGKNVIAIMMESMDDWLITPEDTPNLYDIKSKSIDFTNFYTPTYANGWTFNTEFAFNSSTYPKANGNAAYALVRNDFSKSIASVMKSSGYTTNSFHEGEATFYNRGQIHEALGYEKYHAFTEYFEDDAMDDIIDYKMVNGEKKELIKYDDTYVTQKDELFYDLIGRGENVQSDGKPFYSFIITYSPHLAYDGNGYETELALAKYTQYDPGSEFDVARAKARLTDDMAGELLSRLKEEGLLEDTVILFFADHYTYGIKDEEKLHSLSDTEDNTILERTPAFIYCAANESHVEVDKVSQTVDLEPTLLNLLGIEVPNDIMGRDIFDDDYQGYVTFADGRWITNKGETYTGEDKGVENVSKEEIQRMDEFLQEYYEVKDIILDGNYYALKRKAS